MSFRTALVIFAASGPALGQGTVAAQEVGALTPEQEEILSHMEIVYLDDGQGGTAKTIQISGVNVRVVNGLGATNGYPTDPTVVDPALTATNGLGNLIVGYNETGNLNGDTRVGSHNLVLGTRNSFTSFGGLVGSADNTISGVFGVVSGGTGNTASGFAASVSAGRYNTASGREAAVNGGWGNIASDRRASVSGGIENVANAYYASVGGGRYNTASGFGAAVTGGRFNTASGRESAVSGGWGNTASGTIASVSGGIQNEVDGDYGSVSGGRYNVASGSWSSVSGGVGNGASARGESVAGNELSVEGTVESRSGGFVFPDGTMQTTAAIGGGGGGPVPSGTIAMWNGSIPPQGWSLCDGQDSRPDLRGKFIRGTDPAQGLSVGNTGGATTHSHTGSTTATTLGTEGDGEMQNLAEGTGDSVQVSKLGHTHSIENVSLPFETQNAEDEDALPPYYVLTFIIKD